MGVLIQVRDVPVEVHRTLKARAAEAGVSLSELVRAELLRVASTPTREALLRRIASREPVDLGDVDVVGAIAAERDERGW